MCLAGHLQREPAQPGRLKQANCSSFNRMILRVWLDWEVRSTATRSVGDVGPTLYCPSRSQLAIYAVRPHIDPFRTSVEISAHEEDRTSAVPTTHHAFRGESSVARARVRGAGEIVDGRSDFIAAPCSHSDPIKIYSCPALIRPFRPDAFWSRCARARAVRCVGVARAAQTSRSKKSPSENRKAQFHN